MYLKFKKMNEKTILTIGIVGTIITTAIIFKIVQSNIEKGRCTTVSNGLIRASFNC